MPLHTVHLPGPVVLVPSKSLDVQVRRLIRDHPRIPNGVPQLAADLNSRGDGIPTTFSQPRNGGDWSLLVHGETYVARLFLTGRQDAYAIGGILPLRIRDHHRIAQSCLMLRPAGWQLVYEHRQIPPNSDSHWPTLLREWQRLDAGLAAERGAPPVTREQTEFLDTVDKLIDATERITTDAARSTPPFRYRSVASTSGQRYGTRAIYDFQLVGGRTPDEGSFVQVRGEPEQRGQVTRVAGTSVTVRFDQPVDWTHIPPQGELDNTLSNIVYAKQREAVDLLRTRQAHNPNLLATLVDHKVRAVHPAADEPTELLDDDQREAFRKALTVEDMLLVLGPPGTGKTRTISQIAGGAATAASGGPVLITSHTNRAVDNVLPRLPRGLVVVRVGNDGRVSEEGRPFLLEQQASDLREEILRSTGPRRSGYSGVDRAVLWAQDLGDRLDKLGTMLDGESRARAAWQAARRSVGGPAQVRFDELQGEHQRLEQSLDRNGRRSQRLTRARGWTEQRIGWWLIGALFSLMVQMCDWKLGKARGITDSLRSAQVRVRDELREAEQELDAATRGDPTVRKTRAALEHAMGGSAECRAEAFTAARACRAAYPPVDVPGDMPPPPVRDTADRQTADRDLAGLRTWLARRLPLLAARGRLLTEWHEKVSGETSQLHPELIRYADVIAATSIGAASRPELVGITFDLAIVDEAGQIGIADALVPLVRARRAVLVGDQMQLPPFLDSEVGHWGRSAGDPTVVQLLTKSALEMLADTLPGDHVVPLTVQRRMPSVIADFASAQFYKGNLRTEVGREHRDPLFRSPLAFVDTARLPGSERYERKSGRADENWGQRGCTNPAEAALLTRLALLYHRRGVDWAVIVPYRAQLAEIRAELTRLTSEPETVGQNVGTVDSFQGGERDVILYGFTRSNPTGEIGFLKELRRANVAFTRSKHQLVLVGDMDTLTCAHDRDFRAMAVALRAHVAEHGDIRQYREIHDRLTDLGDESTYA